MTDTIRAYIRKLVPGQEFNDGEDLYENGAVLDTRVQSKAVEGRVANEVGRFENVSASFREAGITARCTCSVRVPICCHAVAVLLHVAENSPDLFGFLGFGESTRQPTGPENGAEDSPAPAVQTASREAGVVRGGSTNYFSALIGKDTKRNCALFLYLLGGHAAVESRWQHMRIKAQLQVGDRQYSAGNMKKILDGTHAAAGMRMTDFTPRERQIIRFLSMHADPQDGSVFELDAPQAADLFHCLIGFERFFTENEKIHVHGQAVDPCLAITRTEEGIYVKGRLEVSGNGALPEGRVVPVAGRGGVWLGVQGHYWWLAGIIDPGWLRFFVHNETMSVDEGQARELIQSAHEGRVRARIVEAEFGEEISVERPECIPVLTLDWQTVSITGVLEFDYGTVRVNALDRRGGATEEGYIVRDAEAESKAAELLGRLGFQRSEDDRYYILSAKSYIWAFLHERMPHLKGLWHLYLSPDFVRKWQASKDVQLELHAGDEGDDWFSLQADFAENRGAGLDWERIAEACRANEDFVTAADGTVMHIPQDVRQVMASLLAHARHLDEDRMSFDIQSAFPLGSTIQPYLDGTASSMRWEKLRERFINPDFPAEELTIPEDLDARLRIYQREGVSWLTMLEETGFHGVLADEMGLGKTIQALAALAQRRVGNKSSKPSLVVCPTSLIENWLIEAKRFAPQLKTMAVRGLQRKHLIERLPELDLGVTSYALLRRDIKSYEEIPLDYLILDEAQHIKNPGTANARTCKALVADHRLILTGTPLENSLQEVWSLFDFLLPGYLGTQKEFRRRFGTTGAEAAEAQSRQELAASIRPFILRRTKDEVCRQLPPKIEQVVYCHLNTKQQKLHQYLLSAGREMVRLARKEGWNARRFQVLSLIMRLRQVCCHPHLLPDELLTEELREAPSAKTELLKEIIEEAIDGGHRILLFSQFTSFLRILRQWLESQDICYEYLDGSTPNRQERVDHFNSDPAVPIFLLSLKAGGTGLNLTGADTVIHYDQWWNPMVEDQATDRTHRIGQDKPVTVYKLVARQSIEERIRQLQQKKRTMFDHIMEGAPVKPGELSDEDCEFLFGAARAS